MYRHFFKRLFDLVIALIGFIIISPLFLLLWIWLSIANKGAGAFFFQERPGITGWAQVNGRNAISWQEKFAYDVWYVDHLSLSLDIKILLKTIEKVFKREGITILRTVQQWNRLMEIKNERYCNMFC